MARRIDSLQADEKVTLHFHGSRSLGNDAYDETVRFVRIDGEGDDRRAVFTFGDEVGGNEWEAYRFKGRWAYGTSAEWLSIAE